jgi:hypothetical protein
LSNVDRRLWQYRQGEARIFDCREAVPASEGWQDLPVMEAKQAPKERAPDTAKGGAGGQTGQEGQVLTSRLDALADKLEKRGDTLNSTVAAHKGKKN